MDSRRPFRSILLRTASLQVAAQCSNADWEMWANSQALGRFWLRPSFPYSCVSRPLRGTAQATPALRTGTCAWACDRWRRQPVSRNKDTGYQATPICTYTQLKRIDSRFRPTPRAPQSERRRSAPLLPPGADRGTVYTQRGFPSSARSWCPAVPRLRLRPQAPAARPRPGCAAPPHPRCRSAARWRRPGGPAGTGRTRRRSRGVPAPAASAPLRRTPHSSRPPPPALGAPAAEVVPSRRRTGAIRETRKTGRKCGPRALYSIF